MLKGDIQNAIGVFGSCFDPVHVGHYQICLNAFSEINFKKIILLPSTDKRVDKTIRAHYKYRLKMIKIAFNDFPYLYEICDREVKASVEIDIYDSLKYIGELYPEDDVYFIVGDDILTHITTWPKGYKLIQRFKLLIFMREFNEKVINSIINQNYILSSCKDSIHFAKSNIPKVSSSMIRDKLSKKENVSSLLVNSYVDQFIKRNNLY